MNLNIFRLIDGSLLRLEVQIYRQQWANKKLFTNYPTDGIVVKINSRKLQLIREKSIGVYPHWAMAIKY